MKRARYRKSEHGFFTIWVLGLVVTLMFMGGISLDLWKAFTARRDLAQIADSAAIAGASQIDLNAFESSTSKDNPTTKLDSTKAVNTATDYVNNAVTQDNITLTGNNIQVVNNQIRVTLKENSDTTLTRIFDPNETFTVTVTGVAEPKVAG
jgi:uncharacterized membrane protein